MIRVCLSNSQISPIDVAQLGRQVVKISKTAHPIAKLVIPMCLPCAYNHQKSNCLMIRVCLGNSKFHSDVAQYYWADKRFKSPKPLTLLQN